MLGITHGPISGDQLIALGQDVAPAKSQGVTGVVLYTGCNLLVTFEGPENAVRQASNLLTSHPIVNSVELIANDTLASRSYVEWSTGMLAESVTDHDKDQINDVLQAVKVGSVALDAAYRAICLITAASVPRSDTGELAGPAQAPSTKDEHE